MDVLQQLPRVRYLGRFALSWAEGLLGWLTDPLEAWVLRRRARRGELTQARCLIPFTNLEFIGRGRATACCQAFTRVKSVGNIRRGSIETIWNGRTLQRIRRRMLLGRTERICLPNCPFLSRPPVALAALPEDTPTARQRKADLLAGCTRLGVGPAKVVLSNWGACNLHCLMCDTRTHAPEPAWAGRTLDELHRYFGGELTLVLSGNGDPLARSDTRALLETFPSDRYPGVTFEILTNGLLWTEAAWARIRHNRFGAINISVDAATKETYEKIRRGGRWDALQRALTLFQRIQDEGRCLYVMINMTVMRSNFREIPAFARMAREHGFHASFQKLRGQFGDENIFELNDQAALVELRQVLADPILRGDKLDLTQLADFLPEAERHELLQYI